MFNYIAEFPNIIDKAIGDIHQGLIAPHLICNFLCGLAGRFSVYYRRYRVLTVS